MVKLQWLYNNSMGGNWERLGYNIIQKNGKNQEGDQGW